jgi:hypothetical protein
MRETFFALGAFVAGLLIGASALYAWLIVRLNRPETARKVLQTLYTRAHPHFLQRSESDPTPVCPCCGFSEERANEAREELH